MIEVNGPGDMVKMWHIGGVQRRRGSELSLELFTDFKSGYSSGQPVHTATYR